MVIYKKENVIFKNFSSLAFFPLPCFADSVLWLKKKITKIVWKKTIYIMKKKTLALFDDSKCAKAVKERRSPYLRKTTAESDFLDCVSGMFKTNTEFFKGQMTNWKKKQEKILEEEREFTSRAWPATYARLTNGVK